MIAIINIRKDLIKKELSRDEFTYMQCNLSNKFLDNLFNKYYCLEMFENYYDREPEVEDRLYDMYIDYIDNHNPDLKKYYDRVKQMYSDFEEQRVESCSWQEPFFDGNWGMSQHYVDRTAYTTLKDIKRSHVSKKHRIYFAKKDNQIRIYFYGRDFSIIDYWFIFSKKKKRKR